MDGTVSLAGQEDSRVRRVAQLSYFQDALQGTCFSYSWVKAENFISSVGYVATMAFVLSAD